VVTATPERFAIEEFWRFAAQLVINSKEYGTIRLRRPYGPQRWVMREIAAGFDKDVHDFTVLKCRQLGMSTVFLALDLWWLFTHGGMDGTLVTQDEKTFVNFRTQLAEAYRRLPKAYKPYSPTHNRNEFVWRHRDGQMSRLEYQIAGTRVGETVKLGRAKGNAFCHGTEVAFWGDQGSFQVLKNSLAEKNPARLYLWESTASGFNAFEEQWRIAERAVTQKAIFVSWWAHELYRYKKDHQLYKVYWGQQGRMTAEESRLAHDVSVLYGDCLEYLYGTKELVPEQIAWYRWYTEEKTADPDLAKSEMPWLAETAFVTTGTQYYASKDLTATRRRLNGEPVPRHLRIEIQQRLTDTQIVESPRKVSNLTIYAAPEEKAYYTLGADPIYGSSDWADANTISVWRCWSDRAEQVAEFWSPTFLPYQFAWVLCYMAGLYSPCVWNLEINGPGAAVLTEIDNLRRQRFSGAPTDRKQLHNFLGGMREFFYSRFDAMTRNPTARGTQSTFKEKNRYMGNFRDYFARGLAIIHSIPLLEEMRWIEQEPGKAPGGSNRHKDDRVIGAALAIQAWLDRLRPRLMLQGISFQLEENQRQLALSGGQMKPPTVYQRLADRQRRLLGIPAPPAGRLPPGAGSG
jgi:hypothetical protein